MTRRRATPAPDQEQEDTATDGDEDEDRPRVRRHATRRKVADEDEEEDPEHQDDEPFASLPVILPRLVSFGAGLSAVGRQFQFNTPLQKEATFPRLGVALSLEAYPLIHLPLGWPKAFGIGFKYNLETGSAALAQMGGAFSYGVSQQRWSIDLRYAIPLGERVVVIPAVGYGNSMFDLRGPTPVVSSMCTGGSVGNGMIAPPCLADVQAGMLMTDVHLRIAATPEFGLSLTLGYLVGLSVGNGVGQLGKEAASTTLAGFHGDVAASLMLNNWLAVQAAIPFVTYGYKFSGGTATYAAANETYYGFTVSGVVFTQ